jgi:hypothetical protein
MSERMRLVQLIDSKRRDRQSSAVETAQVMVIERAIQHADAQLALRGIKEPLTPIHPSALTSQASKQRLTK